MRHIRIKNDIKKRAPKIGLTGRAQTKKRRNLVENTHRGAEKVGAAKSATTRTHCKTKLLGHAKHGTQQRLDLEWPLHMIFNELESRIVISNVERQEDANDEQGEEQPLRQISP